MFKNKTLYCPSSVSIIPIKGTLKKGERNLSPPAEELVRLGRRPGVADRGPSGGKGQGGKGGRTGHGGGKSKVVHRAEDKHNITTACKHESRGLKPFVYLDLMNCLNPFDCGFPTSRHHQATGKEQKVAAIIQRRKIFKSGCLGRGYPAQQSHMGSTPLPTTRD